VGQRQALGYLAVRLFATGFGLALVFFAVFCALTGVLILRSRLMPRVIRRDDDRGGRLLLRR